MASTAQISLIQQALRRHANAKALRLAEGLKKAGLFLEAESKKVAPVDYGVLKASAFTRVENDYTRTVDVIVGYTAAYAVFVHENLDALHGAAFNARYAKELAEAKAARKRGERVSGPFRHNRGPDQQAKFLEAPFRRHRRTLRDIVVAEFD